MMKHVDNVEKVAVCRVVERREAPAVGAVGVAALYIDSICISVHIHVYISRNPRIYQYISIYVSVYVPF